MAAASATAMLWPAVGLVGVTFLVWCRLYQLRLGEMSRKRVAVQALASSAAVAERLKDTRASDNFRNLFELPVLFYVGVLLAAHLAVDDALLLVLAWSFVLLRGVHSAVHCTFNHVLTRFIAYALGALVLWAFWLRLGWWMWSA